MIYHVIFYHDISRAYGTIQTQRQSVVHSLRWCHNELDGISDHQPHDCLLNLLFRRRSKKTSKLCVTGFCVGNSPWTGELPAQKASNAENISIWWRHHGDAKYGWISPFLKANKHYWICPCWNISQVLRHQIISMIWLNHHIDTIPNHITVLSTHLFVGLTLLKVTHHYRKCQDYVYIKWEYWSTM